MLLPFHAVAVIDDDAKAREAVAWPIEEAQLEPVLITSGPMNGLDGFVEDMRGIGAVVSDHQLKVRAYSTHNGADIVAACYKSQVPGILCTRYDRAKEADISPLRRYLPVVLGLGELDPDRLLAGFETCLDEFRGAYRPNRKPWRAIVRVEGVADEGPEAGLDIVVPAWSPTRAIHVPRAGVPPGLLAALSAEDRLYAHINLGAETYDELYFSDWSRDG